LPICDLRFAIEKPLKISLITEQGSKNVFLNSIELATIPKDRRISLTIGHLSFVICRLLFIVGRLSLVVGFSLLVVSVWRGIKNIEDMGPEIVTIQSVTLVTD